MADNELNIANGLHVPTIKVDENVDAKKVGVFAYLSAPADTTVTTAGTYYPLAGTFTNGPVENFGAASVYTPGIKYEGSITRYFEIDWHATFVSDTSNVTLTLGVKKNGVLISGSVMQAFCKTAGEAYVASGTTVIELAPSDEIQLVVTSDSASNDVTFNTYTTTIRPFFW